MEKSFEYRLTHPRYTIYHRAALGGLAATIKTWKSERLPGIRWDVDERIVRLVWDESLSDREALERMLAESFRVTENKLIDLPGLGLGPHQDDLRAVIHNGLCGTFLQHTQMRRAEDVTRVLALPVKDEEQQLFVTYKGVYSYAHQTAKGTNLLKNETLQKKATIPQSLIPGATKGASELTAPPQDVFLLLYLMVACPVFLLRSWGYEEKAQYAIVVPDVTNLEDFAEALQETVQNRERTSSSYGGRVVGGGEEAALRFLVDLEASRLSRRGTSVERCEVIIMGKVAWDKKQINRSHTRVVRKSYPEIGVFRTANEKLGNPVFITQKNKKSKSSEVFIVPKTPIPALIAANLAADRHWLHGFPKLVSEQKQFRALTNSEIRKGLRTMQTQIKSDLDRLVIDALHEAWRYRLAELSERARREGADFYSLVEGEQEKNRNQILRLRTSEALANWFLRFCSAATHGKPMKSMKANLSTFHEFLFNPRNFDRLQNLLLFAMLTYEGSENDKTEHPKNEGVMK